MIYDPSSSSTLQALGDGESLTDTFIYTVSDGNGGTDTASVQVVVNGVDLVDYRLEVLDANGNVTTSVAAGSTFTLVAYTQDMRPNADGVFAAFLDVDYVGVPVTISGPIVHNFASPLPTFSQATFGSNATNGVLDEVGGLSSTISPTGGDEFEVFRQSFVAGSTAGAVNFTANEPEDQGQRGTLLFGVNSAIPVAQVDFGSTALAITSSTAAAGVVFNPNDVNGDGFVSPMDALYVINELNGSTAGSFSTDVNNDGVVSPIDALLVINDLFMVSSGSDVLVGDDADVSQTDLANALEFVFEELASDIQADPSATAALLNDLESPLVDSIYDVINADESEQEDLWDELADDLASLLSNV